MKILKQGLCLALLGAGLAALPGMQAGASGQPAAAPDGSSVQAMRREADGTLRVTKDKATGKVGFARAEGGKSADLFPDLKGASTDQAMAKARAYIDRFGAAFGVEDVDQLVQTKVSKGAHGWTVSYTQNYKGVPVFGSAIRAHLDEQGDLTSVNGFAVPGLDLSTEPAVSAAEAGEKAVSFVKADPPTASDGGGKADTTGIKPATTELVVYKTGFVKGDPGESVLAYVVEVTNERNIRDMLVFDAQTGKILNRWSMVHDALDRELYEAAGSEDPSTFELVWQEGDPFPGDLNQDQQNLVLSAGESYWMFENAFGRDSYDDRGHTMTTVNNDGRINCPNANWNGLTTNYCDGVTSDDVVSHEWGHAYTEYTSGLIYQYQSGALNESYSDVWGETLDLINGREDEGETFTEKRPDGECDPTAPAGLTMTIDAPASVAGPCTAVQAGFGPPFPTTPTTAEVVVATDEANETGPTTTDGCTGYTNAGDVAGSYAYVDRGSCTFQVKVDNAEAAGATGLVVGNNNIDFPISMSGESTIPGVMVGQDDGVRFKTAGTATVTLQSEDVSDRTDSTRWLIGEKSEAFGGAIRDMWTPTCHADPGKVSDAEYKCDPTLGDAGGVHSNSGVPNHAYALAVDGGTYNGQTITGMGLDRAAAIWWRAQTEYLTPSSNFTTAADSLEASCADLVGAPINQLTTEEDATPVPADPITAANCDELAKVMLAVEMRSPVVKCNFQPLLDKDTPRLCGRGFSTDVVWKEDFEDGLRGWEKEFELAEIDLGGGNTYEGGFHDPWVSTSDAPGDHPESVAYGPAPDEGQCTGDGETDFSSRDSIISPEIEMPAGTLDKPRLSFDHYVATEAGYDGGNVKVSINGGDFEVIPAAAYIFNAPGTLFSLAQGNTNPLAGEDGFTGTDGGETFGSWGTSQIDLSALDVAPGDTLQLRFDIGRDGCGGNDGWYVDNVTVSLCEKQAPPTKAESKTVAKAPNTVPVKRDFKVKVKVRVPGEGAATGKVKIFKGEKVLAKGTLKNGVAVLTVRKNLAVGKQKLLAKYLGNATTKPSKDRFTVRIVRR